MASVSRFSVDDLETFSRVLRGLGAPASSMTDAAEKIVGYLFDHLTTDAGEPGCWGVALHKTHVFGRLPADLQEIGRRADPRVVEDTPCLVRIAHAGYEAPQDPGSVVRPLTPEAMTERPVFVQMLLAMGLDAEVVADPLHARSLGLHHRNLGLFLIEDLPQSGALDDAAAREVEEAGLKSIVGVGSALPNGDLFFVFFFTKETVSAKVGGLLRSLVPAVQASLIPHSLAPFGPG
jgi:hypothetical protein